MKFFAILFFLICACSTIHCASTGGKQHTKGTLDYHTWKLASAQENFDRASGEYKTAKAKEVPPGHEQAHTIDLTSKKSVARMYREKIKKNQANVEDLERNHKLPGTKTTGYIVQKDKARAERARARENPSPRQSTPSSSNSVAEKQMTKGDYPYHHEKYKANDRKRQNVIAEHDEMKKKGVTPDMDANQHGNSLFEKQKMAQYYEKKANKNLASMYYLQNNEKLPGPKNLQHIEAKERARNPELAHKNYNVHY